MIENVSVVPSADGRCIEYPALKRTVMTGNNRPVWDRAGKAWKGGICDETVKLFIGIQLVQVQPGQSRSGQAGSECCHSSGDWRVRSVHSK